MAPKYFEGRQESLPPATRTISHSQPTAYIALTTTFVPPATCTVGALTMIPPNYQIWANEPFPVANETRKGCYPSEFMASYTSVTSGTMGSSIVPAMSPIVCPKAYCPVLGGNDNYLACCPSGYQLAPPQTTVDPKRPAYGGTCYSQLTISSTHTIVAYNTAGSSRTELFIASVTNAQAYAHPIDGFAAQPPRMECEGNSSSSPVSSYASPTPSPSSTSAALTPPPPPLTKSNDASSTVLSTGSIAGATVGGIVGMISLIALIIFILRSRKSRKESATINELPDANYSPSRQSSGMSSQIAEKANNQYHEVYEMREVTQPEPIYEVDASEKGMRGFDRVHEMNGDSGHSEQKNWPLNGVKGNDKVTNPVDTKKL